VSAVTDDPSPRRRPLKVGLILPDTEREMGGADPRWKDVSAMARFGEQAGFDSLWVFDHLIYRYEGLEPQGPWECWSNLAALAAITERVEIGPVVCCTSFRKPALLAKIADTVDEISGGRLILGLGSGWNEPDYTAFGYPYDHLVSRFAEAVEIISNLLKKGRYSFKGQYYTVDDCELRPRGPRPEGPPVMIGTIATKPRMLGLVAKYADSWNAWGLQTVAELEEHRVRVDAAMEAAGRDPASLERTVALLVDLPSSTGRPSEQDKAGFRPRVPEELAEHLLSYAAAGISHVQIMLDPNTMEGFEWAARALEYVDAG
jgi:alkanesulfonate monooxygenase SsuD/methylene tetrahydromethanopterin reductase-like flavin-dependent oxidoreductase (luciferase family)